MYCPHEMRKGGQETTDFFNNCMVVCKCLSRVDFIPPTTPTILWPVYVLLLLLFELWIGLLHMEVEGLIKEVNFGRSK